MKTVGAIATGALLLTSGAVAAAAVVSPFPPGYGQAYTHYLAALSPADRKLGWLSRLDQLATVPRSLKIGAQPVTYLFGCKQHACDTDQTNIFLLPDKQRAMAVIRINGVQKLIGGAGARQVACVKAIDASNGTATTC